MTKASEQWVRKVVNLTDDQWREVSEWRHEQRIATESEALRQLISIGLRSGGRPGSSGRAKPAGKRKL